MERPERFCAALLHDIEAVAKETGTEFRLLTYHRAVLKGGQVEIHPESQRDEGPTQRITPALIINGTGAWGDLTLLRLTVTAPRLFGGTKGTHLFTSHPGLIQALGGDAVYAEAADGRLVFLIPLEQGVMIGTTDERFDLSPEEACSTEAEIDYLLQLTREIFPQVTLKKGDIYATCAGIRPLPNSDSSKTAAISRGHSIDERMADGIKVLTLIGGKLTTCRAFGEEVADHVLRQLKWPRSVSTRDRMIPGGEDLPQSAAQLETRLEEMAAHTGYSVDTCRAMFRLVGTKAIAGTSEHSSKRIHRQERNGDHHAIPDGHANPVSDQVLDDTQEEQPLTDRKTMDMTLVPGTALPREFVRRIIETEWVTTLEDLIERRLLLAFEPNLTRETLVHLANLLVESNKSHSSTSHSTIEAMVDCVLQRLHRFYGRQVN